MIRISQGFVIKNVTADLNNLGFDVEMDEKAWIILTLWSGNYANAPDIEFESIEQYEPDGTKLHLFSARTPREGKYWEKFTQEILSTKVHGLFPTPEADSGPKRMESHNKTMKTAA